MDIEQHQKILSGCHARHEKELAAKDALLRQSRDAFEKIANQQVVNTTAFQIATKAIAEIDKEIGK